jgi:hypothetical protein
MACGVLGGVCRTLVPALCVVLQQASQDACSWLGSHGLVLEVKRITAVTCRALNMVHVAKPSRQLCHDTTNRYLCEWVRLGGAFHCD